MQQKPNQKLEELPGTRGFPIVGDVLKMLPDPLPYIQSLHQQYGNVFYAHFAMNQKNVLLLGPEATEQVLITEPSKFSNELGYSTISEFLGKRTVLFQDGAEHKFLRQALNPAFKPDKLRQYLSTATTEIDLVLLKWTTEPSSIIDDINLLTLRIAAKSIVGADVEQEADPINANFLKILGAMVSLVPNVPGSPKWQGERSRAYVDRFFRSRIDASRTSPGHNIFSQLCSTELGLSDDDIVDNMVGVLFASYETTASTIAMMLYALSRNPEWQEPLREELAPLTSNAGASLNDALRCTQTEMVFKETLRLYAPLAFLPRRTREPVNIQGFTIPENTAITLAPCFVHHMPSVYPEPTRFDPERFSSPRSEDQAHRCAWIPFGKGAHACIGMQFARMEVFVFFARLLRKFRIESTSGKLTLSRVPVVKPIRSLPIRLVEI